jgi:hypothetical protein
MDYMEWLNSDERFKSPGDDCELGAFGQPLTGLSIGGDDDGEWERISSAIRDLHMAEVHNEHGGYVDSRFARNALQEHIASVEPNELSSAAAAGSGGGDGNSSNAPFFQRLCESRPHWQAKLLNTI